jgi:predicted ferric reductase
VLLLVQDARFRNVAREVSVLAGLLAVSLLVVALVLPTRVHSILASFGIENVLRTHRVVAVAATVLVIIHIGAAVIGDPRGLGIFDLSKARRPVWAATAATVALFALVVSALRRRRTRPRYEGWRMLHIGLAVVVLVFAGLHIFWLGGLHRPAMRVCYTALGAVALLIAVRRWIWLPVRSHLRSYVVEDVRPVSGNAVTVAVRAHEHGGLPFRAGQFAG